MTHTRPTRSRYAAARWPVVASLAGVALIAGIIAVVQLTGPTQTRTSRAQPLTAEQINIRLTNLQEAFQAAMQEQQDLTRLRVRAVQLAERAGDVPSVHILLAQIHVAERDWALAYEAWARAIELDPSAFEVQKMAGFCAAKLGRLEQAQAHYQAAIDAAGGRADSEVYKSLGLLHLSQNQLDLAEQAFNQALQAPGPGEETNWKHAGHSGLADVAAQRGDFDQAHNRIDRAIRLAQMDSQADRIGYAIQKARLFMDADRDRDALVMLAQTWQDQPASQLRVESAELRALLYERADQLDQAVNHIAYVCNAYQAEADRDDRQGAALYALLAKWQIKAGRYDHARISIDNLQTLAPNHPRIEPLRSQLADHTRS